MSPVRMRAETRSMVISWPCGPLVSQVVVAMARLPSGGVSGRHINDAIARLRGGR
jgi:hypothetical protein